MTAELHRFPKVPSTAFAALYALQQGWASLDDAGKTG
jgi:hypothetical protein